MRTAQLLAEFQKANKDYSKDKARFYDVVVMCRDAEIHETQLASLAGVNIQTVRRWYRKADEYRAYFEGHLRTEGGMA